MNTSSMLGSKPSVSNHLQHLLETDGDEPVSVTKDELDQLIDREQLKLSKVLWVRELDLFLFVLTNRRIISQPLSLYPVLHGASDEQLTDYTLTASGVHWPNLDTDLSLKGLLIREAIRPTSMAY